MVDVYKNEFEKFLAHTDEKAVLLGEIGDDVRRFGVKSILDIGAGNGLLSIPLSKQVAEYIAVEKNPDFAVRLKQFGIKVIEGTFPIKVVGRFDLVLASHSISNRQKYFVPFIEAAHKLVAPGGRLLIITYRGQEDHWTDLMSQIDQPILDYNQNGYEQLVEKLSSLGKVERREVATNVTTDNIEDMIQALSFVASNGEPTRKARFLAERSKLSGILTAKYSVGNNYVFPFQHFFLYTDKTTQ